MRTEVVLLIPELGGWSRKAWALGQTKSHSGLQATLSHCVRLCLLSYVIDWLIDWLSNLYLPACTHVHLVLLSPGTGQKRVLGCPEVELGMGVSPHVGTGDWTQVLCKENPILQTKQNGIPSDTVTDALLNYGCRTGVQLYVRARPGMLRALHSVPARQHKGRTQHCSHCCYTHYRRQQS